MGLNELISQDRLLALIKLTKAWYLRWAKNSIWRLHTPLSSKCLIKPVLILRLGNLTKHFGILNKVKFLSILVKTSKNGTNSWTKSDRVERHSTLMKTSSNLEGLWSTTVLCKTKSTASMINFTRKSWVSLAQNLMKKWEISSTKSWNRGGN